MGKRRLAQVAVGNGVDHAEGKRLVCRHPLAATDQADRLRHTDQTRQALGAAGTRDDSQRHLRQAHHSARRGNAGVAAQRQLEAAAVRGPLQINDVVYAELSVGFQRIEELDAVIPRIEALSPDVLIVTGDHSTPSRLKGHSWHPVPTLLAADTCRPDGLDGFSERACLRGGLGIFPAKHLMLLAMAHALRLGKYGA